MSARATGAFFKDQGTMMKCNGCGDKPITGKRYKCKTCDPDYNLCRMCHKAGKHPEHKFKRIGKPCC